MNGAKRGKEIVEEYAQRPGNQKCNQRGQSIPTITHETARIGQPNRDRKSNVDKKTDHRQTGKLGKQTTNYERQLHVQAGVELIKRKIQHFGISFFSPLEERTCHPFRRDKQEGRPQCPSGRRRSAPLDQMTRKASPARPAIPRKDAQTGQVATKPKMRKLNAASARKTAATAEISLQEVLVRSMMRNTLNSAWPKTGTRECPRTKIYDWTAIAVAPPQQSLTIDGDSRSASSVMAYL